jgi:hypothetical protein
MLSRSSLLTTLLLTTPAAGETPAPRSQVVVWTGDARLAAGHGHCAAVRALSDKVRATDGAYHAQVFAVDAKIVPCLGATREAPKPIDPDTAKHRLGVEGFLSSGVVVTVGGSVRYERRFSTSALTLRLTGLSGAAIESEDDGFDAAVGQIGYRAYAGRPYLAIEAGGTAIRTRRYYDGSEDEAVGAKWRGFPSASLTLGVKLGHVDLGISGLFPFVGVGVHLGVDFAHR